MTIVLSTWNLLKWLTLNGLTTNEKGDDSVRWWICSLAWLWWILHSQMIQLYTLSVWTSQVAPVVKNSPANAKKKKRGFVPWVGKTPLEEGMTTYSSILAWKIPWTEEPGRLQSIGSHRVGHDWSDLAHAHILSVYNLCQLLLNKIGKIF